MKLQWFYNLTSCGVIRKILPKFEQYRFILMTLQLKKNGFELENHDYKLGTRAFVVQS